MPFSVFQKRVAVAFAVLLLVPIVGAVSVEAAPAPQVLGNSSEQECTEMITQDLAVCDSSRNQNGIATITFKADTPESVTLVDAMGWTTGDSQAQRAVTIDGKKTVKIKATAGNGLAGVLVYYNDNEDVYPVRFNAGWHIVPGSPGGGDIEASFTGALFGAIVSISIPAWYFKKFRQPVKELF